MEQYSVNLIYRRTRFRSGCSLVCSLFFNQCFDLSDETHWYGCNFPMYGLWHYQPTVQVPVFMLSFCVHIILQIIKVVNRFAKRKKDWHIIVIFLPLLFVSEVISRTLIVGKKKKRRRRRRKRRRGKVERLHGQYPCNYYICLHPVKYPPPPPTRRLFLVSKYKLLLTFEQLMFIVFLTTDINREIRRSFSLLLRQKYNVIFSLHTIVLKH